METALICLSVVCGFLVFTIVIMGCLTPLLLWLFMKQGKDLALLKEIMRLQKRDIDTLDNTLTEFMTAAGLREDVKEGGEDVEDEYPRGYQT